MIMIWTPLQFQHSRFRIQEKVLRLNVAMTNAQRVDISETSKQLVHVELEFKKLVRMSLIKLETHETSFKAQFFLQLTLIKLIGIVCLFFAYWRATL